MKKRDVSGLDGLIDEKTKRQISDQMDKKSVENLQKQLKDIDTKKLLAVFGSLDPKEVKSKLKNLDLKNFNPEKLKENPELFKKIKKD